VIFDPILPGEDWIEPFRIKIAIVDFVPARFQCCDDFAMKRRPETRLERMSEENQDAHASLSLRGAGALFQARK
jgi:hypothetical protein